MENRRFIKSPLYLLHLPPSLSRPESGHRSIWFLGNFKIGVSGLYMVECGNLGNLSRNGDLLGI